MDERFQNSCVGGCEFSDCRVQLSVSFWARQADPKRDCLAGLLVFPFRKVYWKHNGNKSVEGSAGPTGGPNFGTAFGTSVHQPLYPCQSVSPPRPLHTLYQIGIDRCASPARACGRPPSSLHSHFPHLPPVQHTFYPPFRTNHQPAPPHTSAPLHARMQPYHLTHASLLYIPPKNISLSRNISRPLCGHNSVMASPPPRTPRRHNAPKLRCRRQSTRGNPSCVYLTLYRK